MITHRQLHAARALLGWTQQELADHAVIAVNTVGRIEAGSEMDCRSASYFRVIRALEADSIELLPIGEGARSLRRHRRWRTP